jgi:ketosteroid isomerase-like protein
MSGFRNRLTLYEPGATLVAQPGQMVEGHAAIREALSGFLATKPTLTPERKSLVKAGDIALSVVRWTLNGKGPDARQCAWKARRQTYCTGRPMAGGSSSLATLGCWRLNLALQPHAQSGMAQKAAPAG